MKKFFACFAFASLFSSSLFAAPIEVLKIERFDGAKFMGTDFIPAKYRISLQVNWQKNSGYAREQLLEDIRYGMSLYRQCDLALEELVVVDFETKKRLEEMDNKFRKNKKLVNKLPHLLEGPTVYFVRDLEAFGKKKDKYHYTKPSAYAFSAKEVRKDEERKPLLNSTWFAAKELMDPKYWKGRDRSYSVIAHELGHLLFNDGHFKGVKNLMAARVGNLNSFIPPALCQKLLDSPLIQ